MLAKRKPKRMTERPKTGFPRHRRFVNKHVCIVTGCPHSDIECCHVRRGLPADTPSWARGGTGKKPHDAFTFPGCHFHHQHQHSMGEDSFARLYRVDPLKEALDLARHSPVVEVREFVKGLDA